MDTTPNPKPSAPPLSLLEQIDATPLPPPSAPKLAHLEELPPDENELLSSENISIGTNPKPSAPPLEHLEFPPQYDAPPPYGANEDPPETVAQELAAHIKECLEKITQDFTNTRLDKAIEDVGLFKYFYENGRQTITSELSPQEMSLYHTLVSDIFGALLMFPYEQQEILRALQRLFNKQIVDVALSDPDQGAQDIFKKEVLRAKIFHIALEHARSLLNNAIPTERAQSREEARQVPKILRLTQAHKNIFVCAAARRIQAPFLNAIEHEKTALLQWLEENNVCDSINQIIILMKSDDSPIDLRTLSRWSFF